MGHPKHARKKYSRPRKPWDRKMLEEEKALREQFGIKTKREIWALEAALRKKRHSARKLLAMLLEQRMKRETELIGSMNKIGLLDEKATLDDVLTLNIKELLERRLQTIVYRKGLANTAKQARQFITHGKIAVNGKKASTPSHIVPKDQESTVAYYKEPMKLLSPEQEKKGKKDLKKEFEESAATEETIEKIIEEKPEGEK